MSDRHVEKYAVKVPLNVTKKLSNRTIVKRRKELLKRHLKLFPKDTNFKFLRIPENLCNVKRPNSRQCIKRTTVANSADVSIAQKLEVANNDSCENKVDTVSNNVDDSNSGTIDVTPASMTIDIADAVKMHNVSLDISSNVGNDGEDDLNDNEQCINSEHDIGIHEDVRDNDNDDSYHELDDNDLVTENDNDGSVVADDDDSDKDEIEITENIFHNAEDYGTEYESCNEETDDSIDSDEEVRRNMFANSKQKDWSRKMVMRNNITKLDAVASVVAVGIRSNLTYATLMQSLKNLDSMLVDSALPRTIKGFWSLLSRNDTICTTRHYYCRECKFVIRKANENLSECSCITPKTIGTKDSVSYFIQVNLASQLRHVLETQAGLHSLRYRYTRKKKNVNALEDIYDGAHYRRMCQSDSFLSNEDNFSFTLNTDGCNVSTSSNASAWPILLQINELSPHARKRHILLAGICVDVSHPNLNALLMPTMIELRELYTVGINWRHPINKNEITSKFVTLLCSVDTPARSDILNMTRFNGRYGCTFCYAEGETVSGKGVPRIYPFDDAVPRRTDSDIRKHMTEASAGDSRVFGVIGVSSLMILPEFDLYTGMVVESMHNVYLGVAKLHTTLLLNGKAGDVWYIGKPTNITDINNILQNIRRPSKISRNPRPINEMANWKANEWRNWLMYYALICLDGKARDCDLEHFALLSRAAYILNQDCITVEDVSEARFLIATYVKNFQKMFGLVNMKFNVHLLTHLLDTVENWGPLWAHSAFSFESWNKRVKDKVTSANSRPLQIVTRHMMIQFIEGLLHDASVPQRTKKMIESTLTDGLKTKNVLAEYTETTSTFKGIGSVAERSPEAWEHEALLAAGLETKTLFCYGSATIHTIHYMRHRESTDRKVTRYCDEYVHSESSGFAKILDIVEFRSNKGELMHGFFVQVLSTVGNSLGARHVNDVRVTSSKTFINTVDEVPKPAIIIRTETRFCAIKLPNVWETD